MTNQELDKLVAEKVMGWDVHYILPFGQRPHHEGVEHFFDHENNTNFLPGQWTPSESEEAAFEVVHKMRNDGFSFKLFQAQTCFGNNNDPAIKTIPDAVVSFICSSGPCKKHGNKLENHHGAYDIEAQSVPLAICTAALVALKLLPHPKPAY
jgi:hypothetical protein